MNNSAKPNLSDMCAGELRLMCANLQDRVAQLESPGQVQVTAQDANNYCLILTALEMEEEGDPVAEVKRLVEAPRPNLVNQLLSSLERTHAGHMVGHDQSDQPRGGYSDGYVQGFGACIKSARMWLEANSNSASATAGEA